MSILSYIKSWRATNDRRDILSALENVRNEHTETVTPIVAEFAEAVKSAQVKSKLFIEYERYLHRHINFNQHPADMLVLSLNTLQTNYELLENEVRKSMSVQISADGVTYNVANLIRYIDSVSFYVRYARKLMLMTIGEITEGMGGTPTQWCRAEREQVVADMNNFAGLFNAINQPTQKLKQNLQQISTAVVDPNTAELAMQSIGQERLDLMRTANFSPQRNIFMAIGKSLAEWQVKRYKASKEELTALQLRLQEFKELQDAGNASPRLQKVITDLERQIEKLDAQINKYEEDNSY